MFVLNKKDFKVYFFIVFIVFIALSPFNAEIFIYEFPIYVREIFIFFFFIFSLFFVDFNNFFKVKKVLFAFLALYLYAALTLIFHNYDSILYIIYPLFFSVIIVLLASIYSDLPNYRKFLYILAWVLTGVFSIYALYFPFGDSGYDRLKGPLGNAATIHVLILLVLSIFIGEILYGNKNKFILLLGAILNIFFIIITGSKTAILCLLLFIVLLSFRNFSLKKMLGSIFVLFMGFLGFNLFFLKERIVMEDVARITNLETSLNMLFSNNLNIIFGMGYGKVWPWYMYETSLFKNDLYGIYLVHPTGLTLFHPHSFVLWSFVELGIIGLFLIFYIFITPVFKYTKMKGFDWVLLCGVLSVIPSFLFDSFIIKNWTISMFWILFLFILMSKKLKY